MTNGLPNKRIRLYSWNGYQWPNKDWLISDENYCRYSALNFDENCRSSCDLNVHGHTARFKKKSALKFLIFGRSTEGFEFFLPYLFPCLPDCQNVRACCPVSTVCIPWSLVEYGKGGVLKILTLEILQSAIDVSKLSSNDADWTVYRIEYKISIHVVLRSSIFHI